MRYLLCAVLFICVVSLSLSACSAEVQREPGKETPKPVDPQKLVQRAKLGGEYLKHATTASGRFIYTYNPDRDMIGPGYNMLRHAGTVYAMCELYGHQKDEALLRDAHCALDYMHRRFHLEEKDGETTAYLLDEDHDASLGGNGLALLAVTEYAKVTGEKIHLREAPLLAAWIAHLQQPNGEFKPHVIAMPEGKPDDHVSLYYPGEAMLGLLRLHAIDHNERWVDVAAKGADWLIESRRDIPTDELPPDCWFLLALDELYRVRPKPQYLDHARRLTMAIVNSQILPDTAPTPEWVGGFHRPPRPTPSATRTEALCAAYRLLRDYGGENEPLDAIRAAIRRGVRFQFRMQYTPDNARRWRRPTLVIGGFPASFDNPVIRVDYVQHNIASFLALYNLIKEEKAQGKSPQ